ncbi:hypothetical protein K466DRAFT_180672 [Polyporus arcularius HHB13444]|uniref:Uncharacterized protein n=1 Tax=Polyporus arcularius HHB13444 TaxID=1314778 RepID=A0A5C3P9P6_9APHY|nr:hypothetical protein K466DRAFT_180672 [Polyporus arcularius HHB13444]
MSYTSTSAAGPSRPTIKPDPDTSSMLPPPQVPHRPMPHPNAMSTPNAKGKAPMTATGLHTPIQTPGGPSGHVRPVQGQPQAQLNGGGMAQRNAERHARLKAIQEAQEAQRREDEAASSASVANHAAPQAAVPSSKGPDSDDYLLNSDDDAYFANLDFSALDEGVGRPIDFEEGISAVDMEDDSMAASDIRPSAVVAPHNPTTSSGQHASVKAHPPPQQQQRTHNVSSSSAAGTSLQNQNVPPTSSARPGGLASGERARTPSMGGGFSFPSGHANGSSARQQSSATSQASGQIPSRGANPGLSLSSSSTSSANALKRNADIMQGIAQARRPPQGMGLQHPPAGGGAQAKREPFAALELGESGDVKRPRRG